jgi:hypothetical protein
MMHQRNATVAHQGIVATMMERTIRAKHLSPLRGFGEFFAPRPTDESVGYCRVSLRDKDTIVGDLREIVAHIEQEEGVEV